MQKSATQQPETGGDPPASFPTDAELAIAARLWHEIEERYLPPSEVPAADA
jgi:hypothetical protein